MQTPHTTDRPLRRARIPRPGTRALVIVFAIVEAVLIFGALLWQAPPR